ncbi:hypothetical protein M9H77_17752 [Catharanthus roseus]|uniref:Uncharacterized protein n=1 Tax=Catharanthus roseus TaxID=4058 RepID=A0ACC0B5J5_CATRO|nr:hypothetical protein M9H77_17752 [Catharanthus roseus]
MWCLSLKHVIQSLRRKDEIPKVAFKDNSKPKMEEKGSMSQKAQGTLELLQGQVTRAMARRIEEEHRGKIAGFKKMIQDLAWQILGDQEEDFKRFKTILWSSVQVEESKEANLGVLLEVWRVGEVVASLVDSPLAYKKGVNVIIMYGMKKYQREYDEYYECYDHAAHTYERYNLGAYGRNDCNGSYRDEPKVERRIIDSDNILGRGIDRKNVSLIGDECIIAFKRNLFLLVTSMTSCLSSHLCLEDPLMSSSVMFDPSCYGFDNLDDTSVVELIIVGFALGFDRNSPSCLHHNINERKEAYHGVRWPR